MNYLAHGYRFLDDPYFLAGTAVPDWLSVIDRQVRVRARGVREAVERVGDPRLIQVARGIGQHLADDDQFHQLPAFHELNVQFSAAIRRKFPEDDSFRPAFLGHILVELLLDAWLIAESPAVLDRYYAALEQLEAAVVQDAVNQIAVRPTELMIPFLPRFIGERFLYDYCDDGRLLFRLNQVMRRVKLPALPESLRELLPTLRNAVQERAAELLPPV